MVRAVSCAVLVLTAVATTLFLLVCAAFMPAIAEEPIYEATGE